MVLEREVEYNDEDNWKFPSYDTLKSKEGWVHFTPSILKVIFFFFLNDFFFFKILKIKKLNKKLKKKQGRIVHFKPDFGPDADEEVEMKKIVAKDPFEPRLKSIKEDNGNFFLI